jgi:hypothetical protein
MSADAFGYLFRYFLATVSTFPLRRNDVSKWWEKIFKPGVKESLKVTAVVERSWAERLAASTKTAFSR